MVYATDSDLAPSLGTFICRGYSPKKPKKKKKFHTGLIRNNCSKLERPQCASPQLENGEQAVVDQPTGEPLAIVATERWDTLDTPSPRVMRSPNRAETKERPRHDPS